MDDCFSWTLCAQSSDGALKTYKAVLDEENGNGTLYATIHRSPYTGIATLSKVFVPNEVYIVDDTDYSKPVTPAATKK